jgi:hypothetical protein
MNSPFGSSCWVAYLFIHYNQIIINHRNYTFPLSACLNHIEFYKITMASYDYIKGLNITFVPVCLRIFYFILCMFFCCKYIPECANLVGFKTWQRLKPKIREHIGTKMIFKPYIKFTINLNICVSHYQIYIYVKTYIKWIHVTRVAYHLSSTNVWSYSLHSQSRQPPPMCLIVLAPSAKPPVLTSVPVGESPPEEHQGSPPFI